MIRLPITIYIVKNTDINWKYKNKTKKLKDYITKENVTTIINNNNNFFFNNHSINLDLKEIKTRLSEIEKNTRENTDVAQKMSKYTAVLDFAESRLNNSGLLSYFVNSPSIENVIDETEEPNSDFDE